MAAVLVVPPPPPPVRDRDVTAPLNGKGGIVSLRYELRNVRIHECSQLYMKMHHFLEVDYLSKALCVNYLSKITFKPQ